MDIIFIIIVFGFFLGMAGLVQLCDVLRES
jgi:hypothetical protein